jgi:hypothetical protein
MGEPHHVVVDGSNLATEGRTTPSLAQLDEAVRAYAAEDPDGQIVVVVDASFEHRIDPAEREMLEQAELHGEVVSPPAGAIGRGDAFVLRIAERTGAVVLSNDSFQEFHGEHPWLFDEGRLIGGKPVPGIGWIFTPRIPVRGPKSRQATGKAKRDSTRAATAGTLPAPVKAAELAKAARRSARATKKVGGRPPQVGDVWPPVEPPAAEPSAAPVPDGVDQTQAADLAAAPPQEVEAPRAPVTKAAAEKPAKKAPAKKAAAKKAAAEKPAKKVPAKKAAATKAAATKAAATKAAATKAAAKKAATKAGAKKAPATKKAAKAAATKRASAATVTAPAATTGVAVPEAPTGEPAPGPSTTGPVAAPPESPTDGVVGSAAAPGDPPAPTGGRRRAPLPVAVDDEILAAIDDALVEVLAPPAKEQTKAKTKGKGKGKAESRAKSDKADNGPARRRRATPPPAVNEPLTFINFVATFPVGGELEGEVASFTSHGAMVDVALPQGGVLHCYIPLSAMADPAPRKAREVLTKGERRPFLLTTLDAPRRVAELAVPGVTTGPAPK